MKYVMRAIAFANGVPCPHAGQWLEDFDFEAHGGQGYGTFTADKSRAKTFDNFGDAAAFWNTISKTTPRRPDGRPNKPLTALSVSIDPLDAPGV
jgi:hypothetical protein